MFAGTNKAPLKKPTRSHYEIITSSCYRFFKQLNFHNNMKKMYLTLYIIFRLLPVEIEASN